MRMDEEQNGHPSFHQPGNRGKAQPALVRRNHMITLVSLFAALLS